MPLPADAYGAGGIYPVVTEHKVNLLHAATYKRDRHDLLLRDHLCLGDEHYHQLVNHDGSLRYQYMQCRPVGSAALAWQLRYQHDNALFRIIRVEQVEECDKVLTPYRQQPKMVGSKFVYRIFDYPDPKWGKGTYALTGHGESVRWTKVTVTFYGLGAMGHGDQVDNRSARQQRAAIQVAAWRDRHGEKVAALEADVLRLTQENTSLKSQLQAYQDECGMLRAEVAAMQSAAADRRLRERAGQGLLR
eukprot:3932283-Rhodomonas_salina.1